MRVLSARLVDSVPQEIAKELIAAAGAKAAETDNPMVVTVANGEGSLVAQHRMDGAWSAPVNNPRSEAYTAAALETPTHELAESSQPGNSRYELESCDEDRLVVFGDGSPLEAREIVVAFGVSGGEVRQDRTVAEAGVERWENGSEPVR